MDIDGWLGELFCYFVILERGFNRTLYNRLDFFFLGGGDSVTSVSAAKTHLENSSKPTSCNT